MQVTRIKRDVSITPVSDLLFSVIWAVLTRCERRNAVITGLYKIMVIAVFKPPLIRLKGKNAGSSSSATVSLGQPMYKGVIR